MTNEFKVKINTYKLKYLFNNIRKLQGAKGLLAKKLNMSSVTLDDYLKRGQELLDKYDEQLEEIYDIDIETLDDEISKTKNNYIDEFLEKEIDNTISDKNRNLFEIFFINKKEQLKEDYIYKYQKNIIENIKWSDNESENRSIILLMLFKLIYDRAQMSLDEELLYLRNRYSKTSSRNISIIVKDLERRHKEDFLLDKNEETKSITVNQQINNFTHYSIEHDKALGLIGNNNVIDIKPIEDDD